MHVGILASHPIQYQAPWFRALAKSIDLEVFFAHRVTATEQGKAGFGVAFDWDVDLLSGYRHEFLQNVAANPGVNHFFGCDTPQIRDIIATKRFDAFIVTGWSLKSYWQAIRACRQHRRPILVRGDSQLPTLRSLPSRALKQLTHRTALRQFDGFLSVGQRNREYLRHYGVPAEKIFFVPHFVDNEWFARQSLEIRNSKSEIRNGWKIPEDAFCVLFCGKFIPKKRPMDLVSAAQSLVTRLPRRSASEAGHPSLNIHLLFAGSGELGPELRANCNVVFDAETNQKSQFSLPSRSLGEAWKSDNRSADGRIRRGEKQITDNQKPCATFAGFLNQTAVSRAYVAADVLVLPSESETWGLVVNEAMACGLPAVVSDAVGCAPDLIEEGKTGFTFAPGDCEQLARRLVEVAKLKQQGHDFAPDLASKLRDYSIATAVRGTVDALEKVVHRKQQ